MKTYVFRAKLEEEEHAWTATVPSLPGCNARTNTKERALSAIQQKAKTHVDNLKREGKPIPEGPESEVRVLPGTYIAVTVFSNNP